MLTVIMLIFSMLTVDLLIVVLLTIENKPIMLSVCLYAEYRYAECRCATGTSRNNGIIYLGMQPTGKKIYVIAGFNKGLCREPLLEGKAYYRSPPCTK
jgi:hypothetical protein